MCAGKVVTEEEYNRQRFGPFGIIVKFVQSIVSFIQLFFQSIFNPQSLTAGAANRGGGGGPPRPPTIHRIKPAENCRARGS